jgi:pyridoxine 5-phosphate synthase
MKLGVNVDHIATLRQARGVDYPSPVVGALLAEYAGADSIVSHLREDRRHINEEDVTAIINAIEIPFNLEMSINKGIVNFALQVIPDQITIVPERRQELTTEGGIDVKNNYSRLNKIIPQFKDKGVKVSLFIDPVKYQIDLAKKLEVEIVEINTGSFCEAKNHQQKSIRLKRISRAAQHAQDLGLFVAAGHGLEYSNVGVIAQIKQIKELNIGHSIICRALYTGMALAVEEMKKKIKNY